MDLGLKGRKALVMGASRGLGKAIARAMAAEGANLMLTARNKESLDALADELRGAHGVSVETMAVDTGDQASTTALLDWIGATDRLDCLLANTGGPKPAMAPGIADEVWRHDFGAMVAPMIALMDAAVARMKEQKFGRIMVITSSGIVQPIPVLAVSNTLRASIAAYGKTLADQVAADNITVNMIMPGRIQTERVEELDSSVAERSGKSVSDVRDAAKATIPAGRYGTPEEFAAVATFFLSAPAGYATGNLVRVDGAAIKGIWA